MKTILNPFRMVQPLASDVNGEWLEVFQARKCSLIDHILLYYCGRLVTMVLLPCVFFVIPADPRRHIEVRSLSPVRGIAFPPAFQASGVDSDGFFCGSMVVKILYPPVIKRDNSSNRLYINCVLMGKSHTSI